MKRSRATFTALSPLGPTPVLTTWRRELAAGRRTPLTFDPLWRAACAEVWALEHATVPKTAAAFRREARTIILDAARRATVGAA
jgi:hypothetical protein